MAGREELYLKHIDENTGRIAKALEKLAEARTVKDVKFDSDGLKLIYGNVPVKDWQWIPCSERLPEHSGLYLVTFTVAVEKYVVVRWYSQIGGWIWDEHPDAWMPLPEPYKEEENNSDKSGWDPLWDGR